jgi:hypothetical protein
MKSKYVKDTKWSWSKKGKEVIGSFKLKDGSRTKFYISRDGMWEQWGNTVDNLCLTVPLVEELRDFLLIGE